MNKQILVQTNEQWSRITTPLFTIITPVYNREATVMRTIKSVEAQTFRDYEYIIVNDGSKDGSDEIIQKSLETTDIPMMYIRKPNGGVHTARNQAYIHGRGKWVICIDSDDELVPEACNIFRDAWLSIPAEKRDQYWQIKALCVDQNGHLVSKLFPENINDMSIEESRHLFSRSRGEQIGCRVLSIMKNNLFPEPPDVTFVSEGGVWLYLESKYRSWGINSVVRIYHTEGQDRICGVSRKTRQSCINALWNASNRLNHRDLLIDSVPHYIESIIQYSIMASILLKNDTKIVRRYRLHGFVNVTIWCVLFIPASIAAFFYRKKRMSTAGSQ